MIPFNPFSALTSKIFGGVAIASIAFATVQTIRIEGFLFIHGFKHDVAERDKTIAALIEASKQAKAAQIAVNHEPARQAKIIAEKSNAESPAYYRSVLLSGDANRLRSESSCRQHTDLPGANPPVESVHGSDPAPEMVSRPKSEDDQLLYAAGRAVEMRQEALDLIAKGAATTAHSAGD